MQPALLIFAAICFALGGLFMKASAGATHLAPTAGFLALFGIGAVAQAMAMKQSDMGMVYIAVLGLEAVVALTISVGYLREAFSWQRGVAVALVVIGVLLLRRS